VAPIRADLRDVALGQNFGIALTEAGEVVAWGGQEWRLDQVPTEARTGVDAIAAGPNTAAAIADGRLVVWGLGGFDSEPTVPPELRTDVDAVAVWDSHGAVLRDGVVSTWGTPVAVPDEAASGVEAIAVSGDGFYAIEAGRLIAWSAWEGSTIDLPDELSSGVTAVALTPYSGGAAVKDGRVVVWGQLSWLTDQVAGWTGVTDVAAGENHVVARTASGVVAAGDQPLATVPLAARTADEVRSFGSTAAVVADGRLVLWGVGSAASRRVPTSLGRATAVAAGPFTNMAVIDGRTVVWGAPNTPLVRVPRAARSNVTDLAVAGTMHVALAGGRVVVWGLPPKAGEVPAALRSGVDDVAACPGLVVALKNGRVLLWSAWGQPVYAPAITGRGATSVVCADFRAGAIVAGRAVAWYPWTAAPQPIPLFDSFRRGVDEMALTDRAVVARKDGRVLIAEIGDPVPESVPTRLQSGVTAIRGSGPALYALRTDGSVYRLLWERITRLPIDGTVTRFDVPWGDERVLAIVR
jgi:hypothetical protein